MNTVKDKNLLFYSVHPNDQFSREFLQELEKNPILKRQFVLICVNDPKIRIPDKIKQLNKVPVLIAAGLNRPIFGNDAVSWLKNNSFQEKGNGFEYGSFDPSQGNFSFLGEEHKTSDYNQFFNNEYNQGFVEKDSVINNQFTNLKNDTHITTYDDSSELKKDIQGQLEQRLSDLRKMRDTDVPKPIKRIGGMGEGPEMGTGGGGSGSGNFYNMGPQGGGGGMGGGGFGGGGMGGGNQQGGAPVYNPNPFADQRPPPQQQQQGFQLPFAMPQMNGGGFGGGGGNRGGPALPFSMPAMPFNGGPQGPRLPFAMNNRL